MKSCGASEIIKEILDGAQAGDQWVFDCDGTLINGDISILVGWHLIKSGLVDVELLPGKWKKPEVYLKLTEQEFENIRDHVLDDLGHTKTYEWEIQLQSGLPPETVKEKAVEVLDFAIKHNLVFFTKILPLLAKKISKNAWMVSGSSRPTVTAISRKVGIADGKVLATELDIVDGIYSRKFDHWGVVWEGIKRDYLYHHEVKTPYFVAGDTVGDWNMMLSSKKWIWCVLWDHLRHRGEEFRKHLEDNIACAVHVPKVPGIYRFDEDGHSWVFEVQSPGIDPGELSFL